MKQTINKILIGIVTMVGYIVGALIKLYQHIALLVKNTYFVTKPYIIVMLSIAYGSGLLFGCNVFGMFLVLIGIIGLIEIKGRL